MINLLLLKSMSRRGDLSSMMSLLAVDIAVQHASFASDVSLICTLLSTSKSLANSIHASLKGTLTVSLTGEEIADTASISWLRRNASLLQCLVIESELYPEDEVLVGQALHQASLPSGLLLKSLQHQGAAMETEMILGSLSSRSLTELHLSMVEAKDAALTAIARALVGLKGLQSLKLCVHSDKADPEKLLPAVADLTSLTNVQLYFHSIEMSSLRHLPPQLETVWLSVHWYTLPSKQQPAPPQLHLGHLTACTKLGLERYLLQAEDVLPSNLRQFTMCDGSQVVQPLLRLVQLEDLTVNYFLPLAQIELIATTLTNLVRVELTAEDWNNVVPDKEAEATSRAWARLPLKYLLVEHDFPSTPVVMQHIGQLQGLTMLAFQFVSVYHAFNIARPLAAAITSLQQLHTMSMRDYNPDGRPRHALVESTEQDVAALMRAFGSLPRLQCLDWDVVDVRPSTSVQLTAATALTSLTWGNEVDDFVLNTWAWSLTGLKQLAVPRRQSVTNAALPTIARMLTGLSDLDLSSAQLTDLGVECLTRLRSLCSLTVDSDDVSDAAVERVLQRCAGFGAS